jgi:hypothetical protein
MSNTSCKGHGVYTELVINVIIHMIILFIILSGLFWLFIANKSTEALTKEINENVDRAFDKLNLSPADKINIHKYVIVNKPLLDILEKQYRQPDPIVIKNNNWLKIFNITSLAILVVTLIVVLTVLFLSCSMCIPIWHILKENLILFTFVGLIEGLFFYYIAMKYVPVTPSLAVNAFINRVNDKLNLGKLK